MICAIAMKLRAQQQIQHRQRAHHADQRKRARNRMLLQHHVDGADQRDEREDERRKIDPFMIRPSRKQCHQKAGDQQISKRRGEQKLPGETHQLVVTEAGQRGANPDEDEKQEAGLGKEPEERQSAPAPAAETPSDPASPKKTIAEAGSV